MGQERVPRTKSRNPHRQPDWKRRSHHGGPRREGPPDVDKPERGASCNPSACHTKSYPGWAPPPPCHLKSISPRAGRLKKRRALIAARPHAALISGTATPAGSGDQAGRSCIFYHTFQPTLPRPPPRALLASSSLRRADSLPAARLITPADC